MSIPRPEHSLFLLGSLSDAELAADYQMQPTSTWEYRALSNGERDYWGFLDL